MGLGATLPAVINIIIIATNPDREVKPKHFVYKVGKLNKTRTRTRVEKIAFNVGSKIGI